MYKSLNPLNLFHHEEPTLFAKGQVIFKEGESGDHMYVIKSGSVALKAGDRILETLPQGAIFGEMALIDNEKRSATAEAATDCELHVINEKRFHFLVQETPYFSQYVMKVMADRLRQMNKHAE